MNCRRIASMANKPGSSPKQERADLRKFRSQLPRGWRLPLSSFSSSPCRWPAICPPRATLSPTGPPASSLSAMQTRTTTSDRGAGAFRGIHLQGSSAHAQPALGAAACLSPRLSRASRCRHPLDSPPPRLPADLSAHCSRVVRLSAQSHPLARVRLHAGIDLPHHGPNLALRSAGPGPISAPASARPSRPAPRSGSAPSSRICFLPFAAALALWIVVSRSYKLLAGAAAAIALSSAAAFA